MSTTFREKFDYIILLYPTFTHIKKYDNFGDSEDEDLLILTPLLGKIYDWLKIISYVYEGTNTLIILYDCTALRDVKQKTNEFVNLVFNARHK